MFKKCSKCGEEKELTQFHKSPITSDGYTGWCKDCRKSYNNKYYFSKTKEKRKENKKKNKN